MLLPTTTPPVPAFTGRLVRSRTHVLLPVWEFDLNTMVTGDLLDPGTFGAHNRAVILLKNGAFYCHLGFLGGEEKNLFLFYPNFQIMVASQSN